ncbi:uroporphyrin-3 C-methyltransferase [Marinobacter sp. 3-2]|uniref:uroporphyrinogen-III C-methyltransferase n=1 Tax=Marinobacter sp. 3-2 TaxID=2485141 RepID=UPI000D33E2E5|nr:uroporphyrinogen-III C-methyltransferase [Marinobacter sp. 3-2]ROQ49392.1 uroporphyrin-3 C-methyltransferase [Marinobacter sp. 3-2]
MTETTNQLPATVSKEPPARQKLWPVWLVAILALIIAIALALWSWQQWNNHQAVMQTLQSLKQDTAQLENLYGDRGSQQSQRLQSLEEKLASQRELIATQQRQIDHNARELLEAGNRTRTDWLLAEAEYLLRIANQRLMIEKDIRGAMSALEAADEVLTESDDIGVYPVRQQLAREILALKGLTGVDRTGLYLTLEAAIDSIHQLTDQALISENAPGFVVSAAEGESAGTGEEPGAVVQAWNKVKATLMQVVVVRRMDEPVKPLLSPDQSAYARLNLQLMLEEAEMAVLRGNQPLYERALTKARTTIDDWYNASNPRVTALSETLAELAGKNVDPELPDISQSLDLLKERLAGRLNANNGNGEDNADDGNGGGDS